MVIILLCSVLTIERMLYRKFKRIQLFRKGKKIVGKKGNTTGHLMQNHMN